MAKKALPVIVYSFVIFITGNMMGLVIKMRVVPVGIQVVLEVFKILSFDHPTSYACSDMICDPMTHLK